MKQTIAGIYLSEASDLYQAPHCETPHCDYLIVLDYCVCDKIKDIYNKLQIKPETVLVAATRQEFHSFTGACLVLVIK